MKITTKAILYVIFIISGFTGLIYESIWTHYLKLLLGHASYAQTLVLSLFMGGMAIGAWIASYFSTRWKNPRLLYAIIEAIIGLLALSFHPVFTSLIDYLYTVLFPTITPEWVQTVKWLTAGLLILPQSILLGLTFPLMSSGIIRLTTKQSGSTIAMLYFSNSIGAASGAIISSFVMVAAIGLPGTIKVAGLLNILLAIIVLVLENITSFEKPAQVASDALKKAPVIVWLGLTMAALITGVASFFYEIAWIRMLSMVLGSSIHSFELMLSAFIAGLAFGGLWIRSHINQIKRPIIWFAVIQVIMGLFALLTIPLYNMTFDIMSFLIQALKLNQSGYTLFNIGSHFIAMSVMLPTTFMAGMTLPLLTQTLFIRGMGEKSIGQIYMANTVGAIIGIMLAVHIIIPLTDLRTLIFSGVILDCIIGLAILFIITKHIDRIKVVFVSLFVATCFVVIFQFSHFDPHRMASSVYRLGKSEIKNVDIIHQDGKTASIDIIQYKHDNSTAIATNGKIDARINPVTSEPSADEITMVLMGVLPLIFNPDAQYIANIGLGSGMTSHTILGSPTIISLDTIEIEQAVVDLARNFGSRTERTYTDPRSHIYIEDAKTFFAHYQKKYDVIISEPSNPWVSGVASLFTKEFYQHIKKYLTSGGIFVQWIQLYENNEQIMSSVFKSLDNQFAYYKVFNSGDSDIIIIASMQDIYLKEMNPIIYSNPNILQSLTRVNLPTFSDLQLHYIGNKKIFNALFSSFKSPANSDYYPYLAYNAPKARFMDLNAVSITQLHLLPVPILRMLNQQGNLEFTVKSIDFAVNNRQLRAKNIASKFSDLQYDDSKLDDKYLNLIDSIDYQCQQQHVNTSLLHKNLLTLVELTNPFLAPKEAKLIWQNIIKTCNLPLHVRRWVNLHLAISARNYADISSAVDMIVHSQKELSEVEVDYLLSAGITSLILQNKKSDAIALWNYITTNYNNYLPKLHLNLLKNMAFTMNTSNHE